MSLFLKPSDDLPALKQGLSRRRLLQALLVGGLLAPSPARAQVRDDIIGTLRRHTAVDTDTFVDLARRFDLGYTEMVAANPDIDPWLPEAGSIVLLPTAHILPHARRQGIVVNLAQQRLFYFTGNDASPVITYPVGIGRQAHETLLGRTHVVLKRQAPTWIPPDSIREEKPWLPRAIGPGPDNPLGDYALSLGWAGYVIHGTNRPYSIGRRVSHGCIRLYPEDIENLFKAVDVGTSVEVVNQPVLVGWSEGRLYFEAHPTQEQADELALGGKMTPEKADDIAVLLADAVAGQASRIDWNKVDETIRQRRGVPVPVLRG